MFCSAEDLRCELQGTARYHVCCETVPQAVEVQLVLESWRPINAVIVLASISKVAERWIDRPPSSSPRRWNKQDSRVPTQSQSPDYVLEQLIDEGPGYQDWRATHKTVKSMRRRVRIYNVRAGASEEQRRTIERAARREAELLESLQHPEFSVVKGFTEHELVPALIFEDDPPSSVWTTPRSTARSTGVDHRLDLLRKLGGDSVRPREACHPSGTVSPKHRRPRDGGQRLIVKVFNWQLSYRDQDNASTGASAHVSATSHVDRLVDDTRTAYMAPEALGSQIDVGESLDLFSLGAIAFHVSPVRLLLPMASISESAPRTQIAAD